MISIHRIQRIEIPRNRFSNRLQFSLVQTAYLFPNSQPNAPRPCSGSVDDGKSCLPVSVPAPADRVAEDAAEDGGCDATGIVYGGGDGVFGFGSIPFTAYFA